MALLLSIAALLAGPLIYGAGRHNPSVRRTLDALIVAAIGLILLLHIIPEAFEHGGRLAIPALALGLVFPVLLERLLREAHDTAHMIIVGLAAGGLMLHALIDGIVLLDRSNDALAAAIVLHRLPVGMAIWWIARPDLGTVVAVLLFVALAAATIAGFYLGDSVATLAEARSMALLQAFVAGSLVHVVLFGTRHRH